MSQITRNTVEGNDSSSHDDVSIGTQVAVYWPDDDHWFQGTVSSKSNSTPGASREDRQIRIDYDDGGTELIHTATTKWRVVGTENTTFSQEELDAIARKQRRVEGLQEGSRISLYWPLEKEFFTGTLQKIKPYTRTGFQYDIHYIEYDDGDKEWTNLYYRKFQRVPRKALRLQVGSKIMVASQDRTRTFRAVITGIRSDSGKPHHVKYDTPKKKSEWLNLFVHPFREVSESPSSSTSPPAKKEEPTAVPVVLKKRRREFLQAIPESEIGKRKQSTPVKQEPDKSNQADITLQAGVGPEEDCCVCTRSYSSSCVHKLCHPCFQKHIEIRSHSCPHCRAPLKGIFVKYNCSETPSQEQLKRQTAEMVQNTIIASRSN